MDPWIARALPILGSEPYPRLRLPSQVIAEYDSWPVFADPLHEPLDDLTNWAGTPQDIPF